MTNSNRIPNPGNPRMHNDEPPDVDGLERGGYVDALSEIARTCETPAVVGLYGRWGVGKTSLMKQIKQQLDADESVRTVWFDPWRHQFDENPVLSLMHTMVSELDLGNDGKEKLKTIAWALGKSIVNRITDVDPNDIQAAIDKNEEENFKLREERVRLYQRFEDLIHQGRMVDGSAERRIVFFIDDLDRCLPAHTLLILESLKLFLNFDGCVYFLGADRNALESSIRYHYQHSELDYIGYLDKIVQIPFDIPPIARVSMDKYIQSLLPPELAGSKRILELGLSRNPRSVKRFINSLWLNHHLAQADFKRRETRLEPNVIVLAALLLIQDRNSELYRRITRDPGLLGLLVTHSKEGDSIRETHIGEDEELIGVLMLAELEFIAELADDEVESYVTLTDASPIQRESVLVTEDSEDDFQSGPDSRFDFLSREGLKQVLVDSGFVAAKSLEWDFLLLFDTRKQKTWLAVTNDQIVCLLDDQKTRTNGHIIQWRQALSDATPVRTYSSGKSALIDIGSRRRWLYSKRLHPDGETLGNRINGMIEVAKVSAN